MSCIVSFVNMKGGVGKSTLVVNLAWTLSFYRDVLVVDLDPQSNASQYLLGLERYKDLLKKEKATILNVFEQNPPAALVGRAKKQLSVSDVICKLDEGLDLIPASLDLSWTLKDPKGKENLLAGFLTTKCKNYQVILIDCPPTESIFTTAAYLASRYVIVPVKPDFLSTIGLPLLKRSIDEFHSAYGQRGLEIAGIIFNNVRSNSAEHRRSKKDVAEVASQHGWYIFNNEMAESESYAKAARLGKPLMQTPYARRKLKGTFDELVGEFLGRVGLG